MLFLGRFALVLQNRMLKIYLTRDSVNSVLNVKKKKKLNKVDESFLKTIKRQIILENEKIK